MTSGTSHEPRLDARRGEWIARVNAGDLDGYTAMMADDVIWIPPGQAALDGRDNVRAWLAPMFEEFAYELTVTGVEVRVTGDWAVERGVFTSRLRPRAATEWSEHGGLYFLLWKRRDDEWYIGRYVDVTDLFREPKPD
jgi:uncharacterized protein (TIGR02246 family)